MFSVVAVSAAWGINSYSSYDFQDFVNAKEISGYIKANSNPNDTIFGDDATTPLLALLSDRGIALNFADSNNQRFRSGVTDINYTIGRLKAEGVKFIIVQRLDIGIGNLTYGPAFMEEFEDYIENDCRPATEFPQKWRSFTRRIYVYDCEQQGSGSIS